jgi:hypothetical protein
MKFKLILITLTGTLFFGTNITKAQTDTLKLTASHLASASQLIESTGMTGARLAAMRGQMIESMSVTIHIPEKNKQKFINDMNNFMNKYLPLESFKGKFVRLYAETFTEDELNQLISFYRSPLGEKILAKLPVLMQKGMLMNQEALKDHVTEIESIVTESLKE